MYIIVDKKEKIVAVSDSKKITKRYIENHMLSNRGDFLNYHKIKNKKLSLYNNIDDLILVRYGDTYIQKGYIQYLEMADSKLDEDEQFAIDIISRVLELKDLDKKESKTLIKAAMILEKYRYQDSIYTPSLNSLKEYKDRYEKYMNNTYGG